MYFLSYILELDFRIPILEGQENQEGSAVEEDVGASFQEEEGDEGPGFNEEVEEARKKWNFQLTSQQSISDSRGSVLIIKNIRKK